MEFSRVLSRGEGLYHDPNISPYLHAAYPPVFPILEDWLSKGLPGTWFPGRLLAFSGYLGCALALLVWGWSKGPIAPAAGLAVLFLLSPTWAAWGTMVRVDCFVTAIVFISFLLLKKADRLKLENWKKLFLLITAGFLTALAVFCKQPAITLVIAFGLTCLLEKKWKDFLWFGAAFGIPSLSLVFYLQDRSQGFFWKQTVLWVSNYGFQPDLLVYYLKNSFMPECGWLLAGVILTFLFKKTSLFTELQTLMALLTVLGLAHKASAENYYMGFILFGLFFIGEGWLGWEKGVPRDLEGKLRKEDESPIRISLYTGFLFPMILIAGLISFNLGPWPRVPSAYETQSKEEVLTLYRQPGEYLALDLDLLVMAGKRILVQPAEYTGLVEKGLWSSAPLVRDIRAKKFATIELYDIPRQYLLPNEVTDEINLSYRVFLTKFGRKWYIPKKD